MPRDFGGGSIYVSPDASLKFWKPNIRKADPALFDWASEFVRPGDIVWDIGANVGLFTFAAASRSGKAGHVLAVEADTTLAALLQRSARRRPEGHSAVSVLPVAVGGRVDVTSFLISERGRSTNHLGHVAGSTQTGGVREATLTVTTTLDWLLERLPPPNVIKIDVEGAENHVLEGATQILSGVRPLIICEVHSANADLVAGTFLRHGYDMYDLAADRASRKRLELPAFNTLAVPKGDRVSPGGAAARA